MNGPEHPRTGLLRRHWLAAAFAAAFLVLFAALGGLGLASAAEPTSTAPAATPAQTRQRATGWHWQYIPSMVICRRSELGSPVLVAPRWQLPLWEAGGWTIRCFRR